MKNQKGISLIELMISMLIGLILMSGVVQLFISSKGTFSTQKAMSRVQETGRLAIDFMAKDIRLAGYAGCMSRGEHNVVDGLGDDADGDYLYDFDEALRGYDADTAKDEIDIEALEGTDVLVVRSAGSSSLTVSQNTGNNANLRVNGTESGGCMGDVCIGDIVVISDCAQARRFQVTNFQSLGSGQVNVVHAASGTPGNQDPNKWGQQFDPGAEITRTSTIVYYLAENDFEQPTLFQKTGAGAAVELLEGVEDLRITYSASGGNYEDASAVADWDAVTSMNIEMLVRSANDNVIADSQPYTFNGVTTTPADRRLRQVFTTTIALRNRLQ